MAQAKTMKMKEYGTDILSHNDQVVDNGQSVRVNNTFKSSVMTNEPDGQRANMKSRDNLFKSNPLQAQIQRTSYQDSNIFGYKDQENVTVQNASIKDSKEQRVRNNPTFESRVFSPSKGGQESGTVIEDEQERPRSRQRNDEKWQSKIFDGPMTEQSKRKKLGQKDAGTGDLFGSHQIDYSNKSNIMPVLQQKKAEENKWKKTQQKEKTAEQRKKEELYGKTIQVYQGGKKGDGSLMGASADWRNLQQTHTNGGKTQLNQTLNNETAKDKKHQNLSSNIFGNEEGNLNQSQQINQDVDKVQFGSNAGWNNQAAHKKPNNKKTKVDTYQKKKAELSSSVFDLPDYSQHVPLAKKQKDVNNLNDEKRRNDHMYSDILGAKKQGIQALKSPQRKPAQDLHLASNTWSTADLKAQLHKDYSQFSSKNQKHDQLKSSLDTHNYEADPSRQLQTIQEEPNAQGGQGKFEQMTLNCKSSTATKVRDLSSDILGTGNSYSKFSQQETNGAIIDLDLKALPPNIKEEDIKNIANIKQVISVSLDQDPIKNECTGTGRIKARLGPNEDADNVMLQFLKKGYGVQDHFENPKKKSGFTTDQALRASSPMKTDQDAKLSKLSNLQTSNMEAFGNTQVYQQKFNCSLDTKELNVGKQSNANEAQAINNWKQVSGKK